MSEDRQQRTEQPTPRRLERARREGQVPYSSELIGGLLLMVGCGFFHLLGPWIAGQLADLVRGGLAMTAAVAQQDSWGSEMLGLLSMQALMVVAPLLAVLLVAAAVAGGLLTGGQLSAQPLAPQLKRLDPRSGFRRIWSSRSVVRGLTSIAKLTIVSVVSWWMIVWQMDRITATSGMALGPVLQVAIEVTLNIALAIAAAMVVVGLADYMFQRWKHLKDLQMSRREIQDERRSDEGDPHMRARIKRLQREVSQRKMLRDVPTATAVITNPTHYAVALRYERGKTSAPVVVAKGTGLIARRIIQIAEEHRVEVVRRPEVARALYAMVEVGKEIPSQLFHAVAEILAYVYRTRAA